MGKKWRIAVVIVILISMTVISCGEKSEKVEKKILNASFVKEPKSLDIARGTDVYAEEVLIAINEGLARVVVEEDGTRKILPAGAESWTKSEDGLTWTFHLREYNWSDGTPVVAEDFVYGIQRILDPQVASYYAYILYPIQNATAFNKGEVTRDKLGVRAIDPKTLEVKLEAPCPYFEDLTYFQAMLPQRKDKVEEKGEQFGAEAEGIPSCGPFVLKEWIHDNLIVLEKNPGYWDEKSVKIDGINIHIIKDQDALYSSLYNNTIDFCTVENEEWMTKFEDAGTYAKIDGYEGGAHYLLFNQQDALFQNKNIRLAFSLGVAREEMADVLFKGTRESAYGLISPTLKCQGTEFRDIVPEPLLSLKEQNPNPRALLEKGLKELGIEKTPEELEITFLNAGTEQQHRTFTEFLQQMYKRELGVTIQGEYVEWGVYLDRMFASEYQICHSGWNSIYNDPMSFLEIFTADAEIYNTNWENKEFDKILTECRTSEDRESRIQKFERAEKILLEEDVVISPTGYRKFSVYVSNRVKGLMKIPYYTTEYKYVELQ